MRTLVAFALVLAVGGASWGRPLVRPPPPRPIDGETFARLVEAVRSEPFPDGKLGQIRAVAACRQFLFDAPQAIVLLDQLAFWTDRLEALRLLPIIDRPNAAAVLRWFDPAPPLDHSEAQRVLGL